MKMDSIIKKIEEFKEVINTHSKNYNSMYLDLNNELKKLEETELKEKLISKLNNIYQNRINGKGKLTDGAKEQIQNEFDQMLNMISKANEKENSLEEQTYEVAKEYELNENIKEEMDEAMNNNQLYNLDELVVLEKVESKLNDIFKNLKANEFNKITATVYKELTNDIANIENEKLKDELIKRTTILSDIFIQKNINLTKETYNKAYSSIEECLIEIKKYKEIKMTNRKSQELRDKFKTDTPYKFKSDEQVSFDNEVRIASQFLIDTIGMNLHNYQVENINRMSGNKILAENERIRNSILSKPNGKEELESIEGLIRNRKNSSANNNENNSNNNEDNNKNNNKNNSNENNNNNNNDDNNTKNDVNDDLRKKTEEAIEKIKETLDPKAPKEELDNIIEKMNELIMKLFNYEQSLFESKLKEKDTVEEKMDLIEKRQNELDGYGKFYESTNPEISNLLLSSKEKMLNDIKTSYATAKSSGEYTWANYESVKESKEYIEANIYKDADFKFQFDTLLSKMEDIIKNPEQEQYENWKINMNEFTDKLGLNSSEIIPYMNARAKLINPNLDIDKEYNINGLGLNVGTKGVDPVPTPTPTPTPIPDPTPEPSIPTSTEKPPIKQRLKVVAKKALNWMKEHKLITIGLGLALTTVLLFSIPATHMMINSCLWGVGKSLGWSTATLDSLHGINLGLAKGVAGGKYLFESASGAYTLAGTAGAKALYSAGAANLVGAVTGLTAAGGAIGVGGALVKMGAAVKEKIKNALSKKKDQEEYEEDFFPENEEQVELEKEKNKTNELTEIKEQIIALQQQSREMQEQLESERKKSDQLLDTNLKLINLLKSRGLSDEEIKESLNNNSDELENEKTQVIK